MNPALATASKEIRIVRPWVRLSLALIFVAAAFALAYLHASAALGRANDAARTAVAASRTATAAAVQAQRTADCVNNILALRAAVNATDAAAYKAFIDGVAVLAAQPAGETAADQRRSFDVFKALVVQVKTTLDQDEAFKSSHPLGKC